MIKFKLTHPNAKMPTRAKPGDAGFDLCAVQDGFINECRSSVISTGIQAAIPDGWVGIIKPRSGLAVRSGIDVLAGVIDSGFRGEICVVLQNHGIIGKTIKAGDKVAQLVVVPYMGDAIQVDELDDTERGDGGFGHTGE